MSHRPVAFDGATAEPPVAALWSPMLAVAAVVLAFSAWNVRHEFDVQRDQARARLQAVNELRGSQVEAWVNRQMSLAHYLSSGHTLPDLLERWQDHGDTAARDRMLMRAISFRQANDADAVLILDPEARTLASDPSAGSELAGKELRDAVAQAVAQGKIVRTDIYRTESESLPVRMDVVVPLLRTDRPLRGVLIVRLDPRRSLFPPLAAWPIETASGESMLWRVDGNRLVNVSDGRIAKDSTGRLEQSLATSTLPIARTIRGEATSREAVEATDYRGVPVLATATPVAGTGWWLLSKIDVEEVDAPVYRTLLWTGLTAALALFGVWLATRLWLQRQALVRAQEGRAAERERLQTLQLLEAITESASDAIFAKDLAGRYVFYNRAAADAIGKEPADVLGRTDLEVFGAEVAARFCANDREALEAALPIVFEEEIPGPCGSMLGLCTKGALLAADGSRIGLFGVSRDVTETRRAERALRDSEAHYRTVVSVLSEGILVSDREGVVLSCNPAAERIVGVPQRDWQGRNVVAPEWVPLRPDGSVMPPEETPPGRVLAGASAQVGVELWTRDPSGRAIWFEVSALPVLSPEGGELMAVVTSFTDVTHRKALEAEIGHHRQRLEELVGERTEALQRANASLAAAARFNRALTDAMPGRVAYWDAEFRCRFANRHYAGWFDRTPEEMIGVSAAELITPAEFASLKAHVEGALDGESQSFERDRPNPDGSPAVHQIHWVPERSASGAVSGAYVMAFDITAIKHAQADLIAAKAEVERARDVAESANRAKSAFLANMSHEIRTPMNAIIGLTHLMSRDTRDTLQRDRLGKVGDAAQHLLQVINDVLDISKIEAGKMALEESEFALAPLLARALQMVGDRARDKGLELMLDTANLPERLRGDPTRLSQALINLLSNAVKFTERGWVRMRAEVREREAHRLQLRFEVQDTGAGIAPEFHAQLFNAFEQADSSATRRHGGTGLGLALTRQLATLMGGATGVDSRIGTGSTFWFSAWFGIASEADEAAAPIPTQGMRALLVDGFVESSTALAVRLRAMGVQVDVEADAVAAQTRAEFEFAAARPYDVVLIDDRAGRRDGGDTVAALRATLGTGLPPCILLTDAPMLASGTPADAGDCDAVLPKPVTASTLNDALARVMRKQGAALTEPSAPGQAEALLRLRHTGQRVLLAEDNPVNRDVASELIRSSGLLIETAENGAIAVELALSRRYDLILMDMQMPVLDGLAATRLIREKTGRSTPIIALTANAFVDDRAACIEAGMNDHVCKPVDPDVLYATLLRWLPLIERQPGVAATEPAGASAPLQQRLEALEGFNVATALRNVGGKITTVARVLGRFVESYRDGVPELLDSGAEPDPQRLRSACHSLRGACATIGAIVIEEELKVFERGLRDVDDVAALGTRAGQLNERLKRLVGALEAELQG